MCKTYQLYDFIKFFFPLRKLELYHQHMNTHSNKLFLPLDRFRADSFPFTVITQGVSTQPIQRLKQLYTPTLITLSLQITVKLTRPVNPLIQRHRGISYPKQQQISWCTTEPVSKKSLENITSKTSLPQEAHVFSVNLKFNKTFLKNF